MPATPAPQPSPQPVPARHVPPNGAGDRAFSVIVSWLTRHGISLLGSRILTVRGRKSGTPHSVPVNLLTRDGERFLVSPRGNTHWVRNLRVAGQAELRVGRRTETVDAVELPVEERLSVIRLYLEKWGWEVGRFVEGLTKDSSDAEILAVAGGFPVFRLSPR